MVLDEQLNPVITSDGKNSYFEQVGTAGGTSVKQYNIIKRAVTKSGYVYVYVSNETPNIDVYWDNLKVTQKRGRLASEEGYYPFGLAMNALSSHAGTIVNNAYKYNSGTELTEDLDVDYYETYLRQYDAQVGRFTDVDVLSEMSFNISTYAYATNDPIYFNDPSGALKMPDQAPQDPLGGMSLWSWIGFNTGYYAPTGFGGGYGGSYGGGGYGGGGWTGDPGGGHGGGGGGSMGGSNGNPPHKEEPLAPVNDGNPNKLPPVFWDEALYPNIEEIDRAYYNNYAPPQQKIDVGGKWVFLLFQYLGDNKKAIDNRKESEKAFRKSPNFKLNPNTKLIQRHEVPYASTIQGGALAYSDLAPASQNTGHGTALGMFYTNNNMQPGDKFLVPLPKNQMQPQPAFIPVMDATPILGNLLTGGSFELVFILLLL